MYIGSGLKSLSKSQISKLLNNHSVRVSYGNSNKVELSPEQHKKLMKAHAKQKGITIRFDPYQIAQHQYLRGSLVRKVFVNKTISPVKQAASARLVKMIEGSGIVKKSRPLFVNKTISPIKKAASARLVKAIEGSGVNRIKKFDRWTGRIGTASKAVAKFVNQ